jgi:hypothetical protein
MPIGKNQILQSMMLRPLTALLVCFFSACGSPTKVSQDCGLRLYCPESMKLGEEVNFAIGIQNKSLGRDLTAGFPIHVFVDGVLWQKSGGLRMPPPGKEDKLTLGRSYKAQKLGIVEVKAVLILEDANLTNNEDRQRIKVNAVSK